MRSVLQTQGDSVVARRFMVSSCSQSPSRRALSMQIHGTLGFRSALLDPDDAARRPSREGGLMTTRLEVLQQLVDGKRPPPPIASLIGFTLSAVGPGEAVIEFA